MICLVEWGARAGPESLKIQKYPCILHDLFRGRLVEWGAWAGPESLTIQRYPCLFHDLLGGGGGGMGGPREWCARLGHTAGYRRTSNPLVPFRSDSQQQEMMRTPRARCRIQKHKQPIGSISVRLATIGNDAPTYGTLQDTETQATHWFHFGQTRNNRK
jgi:hypothetical protein